MEIRDRVEARLAELRADWEKGERRLAELQAQEAALRQALLRISGAMQVLEETLSAAGGSPASSGAASVDAAA